MSGRFPSRIAACRLAVVALIACAAQAPSAKVAIDAIRIGFDGTVKPGSWVPLAIDIESKDYSGGAMLQIATPDADGAMASLFVPNIPIEAGVKRTVRHYVKLAQQGAVIELTLQGQDGPLARRTFELGVSDDVFFESGATAIVVNIGSAPGLREPDDDEGESDVSDTRVVSISSVDELPTQWFAYEAVDVVVLAAGDAKFLSRFPEENRQALRSWVRQGGRLFVSVGADWQIVAKSFLAEMLPADILGMQTAGRLDARIAALETLADAKGAGLEVSEEGVPVAILSRKGGRQLPEDSAPVLVTDNYGFGEVSILGLDVQSRAFRQWPARREFWAKVLELPQGKEAPTQASGNVYANPTDPFGGWVDGRLQSFPDVSVVPFSWIAVLILGYILLIGPIDYFFLKRFVGRLELTWLTFPIWVLLVSVGAYLAAYRLKGNELRVNRMEVLDVDLDSATLRGRDFVSVFSPVIDRYTVTTTPGLAANGSWDELGMGTGTASRVTSCLGPLSFRDSYGRAPSAAGGFLDTSSYRYASPEPVAVLKAPIRVWSDKSFTTQWLAQAGPILEADVRVQSSAYGQVELVGRLTNRLDTPIHDAVLLWNRFSYRLDTLSPDKARPVEGVRRDSFASFTQQIGELKTGGWGQSGWQRQELEASGVIFARNLSVWSRQASSEESRRNALSSLSLRRPLDQGKAVLIGRVDVPAGKLWLDNELDVAPDAAADPPAVQGVEQRYTILRVVLEPKADD